MKIFIILIIYIALPTDSFCMRYVLHCDSLLLKASLDTALMQAGTCEKSGRNDGDVERYVISVGGMPGQPYCAAGQYYCFLAAAKALSLPLVCIPIMKTSSSQDMFRDAKTRGRKSDSPAGKHDLVFWRKMNKPGGHVERVLSAGYAGWLITVGFNTSVRPAGGSISIEGVFIKRRNILHPVVKMTLLGIIGFEFKHGGDNGF